MNKNVLLIIVAFGTMAILTGIYVLTGENPVVQLGKADNVVKVEAAGVNYAGWPELAVHVNGKQIGKVPVETSKRQVFSLNVPNDISDISTVEIKFPNSTDCRKGQFSYETACTDRKLIVRKVFLNEKQLENGDASGDRNTPFSLQSSEGGIKFDVAS